MRTEECETVEETKKNLHSRHLSSMTLTHECFLTHINNNRGGGGDSGGGSGDGSGSNRSDGSSRSNGSRIGTDRRRWVQQWQRQWEKFARYILLPTQEIYSSINPKDSSPPAKNTIKAGCMNIHPSCSYQTLMGQHLILK